MNLRERITARYSAAKPGSLHIPRVLLAIFSFTLLFALHVPRLQVYTDFNDLLPQKHPYIQTYNRIKENFGAPIRSCWS